MCVCVCIGRKNERERQRGEKDAEACSSSLSAQRPCCATPTLAKRTTGGRVRMWTRGRPWGLTGMEEVFRRGIAQSVAETRKKKKGLGQVSR